MKIKDFIYVQGIGTFKYPMDAKLTYLIFGGQASLYITSIEYIPTKGQLKLKSGNIDKLPKSPEEQRSIKFNGAVKVSDLYMYPEDTEILIEGYPGDTPEDDPEWETPDNIEFNEDQNTIDFQILLSDEERDFLEAEMKIIGIRLSALSNNDIPKDIVTKAIEELLNNY